MFDHKNKRSGDKRNWGQTNQISGVSMSRIKDAASLEPPLHLINQELQDESTDESAGYLPRLAAVQVLFVTGK